MHDFISTKHRGNSRTLRKKRSIRVNKYGASSYGDKPTGSSKRKKLLEKHNLQIRRDSRASQLAEGNSIGRAQEKPMQLNGKRWRKELGS